MHKVLCIVLCIVLCTHSCVPTPLAPWLSTRCSYSPAPLSSTASCRTSCHSASPARRRPSVALLDSTNISEKKRISSKTKITYPCTVHSQRLLGHSILSLSQPFHSPSSSRLFVAVASTASSHTISGRRMSSDPFSCWDSPCASTWICHSFGREEWQRIVPKTATNDPNQAPAPLLTSAL